MKFTKTITLIILITISVQIYILNGEEYSETVVFLSAPIVFNMILLLIYVTHNSNLEYSESIENTLKYSLIISTIYCVFILYLLQLGKAFKN